MQDKHHWIKTNEKKTILHDLKYLLMLLLLLIINSAVYSKSIQASVGVSMI